MSKISDFRAIFAKRQKSPDTKTQPDCESQIEKIITDIERQPAPNQDSLDQRSNNNETESLNSQQHRLSKRKTCDFEANVHCDSRLEGSDSKNDTCSDIAPDGGLKAWLVTFGSFCGCTVVFGIMDSIGAIEAYLSKNQLADVSASTVGWIFSLFIIFGFGCIFITGQIFDKIGAKIPMVVGTALMFLGLFTTANSSTVWQFILSFSVTSGIACGIMLAPLVGILPQYFDKRIGLASAITSMGGSVGGTIYPVMLRRLYSTVGYVWAMRIFAFVNLGLLVLACIFVAARIEPTVSEEYKQKSLGGKILDCLTKSLDMRSFFEWQFCLVTAATLFSEAAIVIIVTYFASYASVQGASENTAYFLLTLINLVGIPARWATGMLADKFGKFNVMTIMVYCMGIVLFVILLPFGHHIGALYAFAVCFGIVSCSVFTLTPVCLAQITRVDSFGKRYGTMYLIATLGNMFIPAGGAIIGSHSSRSGFDNYVIFAGVVCLVGGSFWLVARYVGVKARLVCY